MDKRWQILAVLFFTRMAMAFQFQSVAALSPLISETYAVQLADIGLLIGLYLAPGVFVAIPGGAIAARFGEKRVVALSLALMLLGGVLAALGGWTFALAGRVIAGAGGVIINIVLTKMLVDWFQNREINTAMAIFINSWPVGIALALVSLPFAAELWGLQGARVLTLAMIGIALALFGALYQPATAAKATRLGVTRLPFLPLCLAGLVWALYNTALAMVFSFGPALLAEKGWSLGAASSVTSLFMLLIAVTIPLGGVLADRTGRPVAIILTSLVAYIVLLPLVPFVPPLAVAALFLLAGACFGLGAGPIMALPAAVLPPESRTFGMGVFFTIYYVAMTVGPAIAGAVSDLSGSIAASFVFGAALVLAAVLALLLFRRLADQRPPAA